MGEEMTGAERKACGWLMRQCEDCPELAVSLNSLPWLAEAVGLWVEHDDRHAPFFGHPDRMTPAGTEKVMGEVLRVQSLAGRT